MRREQIVRLRGRLLTVALLAAAPSLLADASTEDKEPPQYPPAAGSRRALYAAPEDDLYKSPLGLVWARDGSRIYVVCEDSDEVLSIDAAKGAVVARAKVGRWPFDVATSPDGRRLYVSNREGDSISVLDVADGKLEVAASFPVGDAPHGLVTDATGAVLYVAHLHADDVGLYDTATFKEIKRLSAGRSPFEVALSPDGKRVYVSSQASIPVKFRTPSILEVTFIDTGTRSVVDRRLLPSTVTAQGIAVSPDNQFVVVALALPKNLLPETQIFQGWMVTYGFAVLEAETLGRSAFLLIDEPHLYYSDPFGIAFSKDGKRLFISSSGANVVTAVDFERVREILKIREGKIGITEDEVGVYARHLGLSNEHVLARIEAGTNPKAIAMSPDGSALAVAERFSDAVEIVDPVRLEARGSLDLGGPKVLTKLRRGAILFNDSKVSFQRQLSCTTCHPENHVDGLQYDIGLDGLGLNLVDNRTLRGIWDTGPFKWNGKNPTIHRQEGPRAAMLFFRSHGFEESDTLAIVAFLESLPLFENRYRPASGKLNEFQKRGKKMFERGLTRDGRYIPIANRCITCHPPPYYTDKLRHDVGSKAAHDTEGAFDTPQLNNIHLHPPYLHDGRCYSLEEIWTVHNPDDTHGQTNDMTKDMLNDLIEYLKTL